MKRRDFIKTIGGVITSLLLTPFHSFARHMDSIKNSDDFLTSKDDDIRIISEPWYKTIFTQFENQDLKIALERYAEEIHCTIWYGEPSSPDIIAVPYYVAVIELNAAGLETLEFYNECLEDEDDDTPFIIVGDSKDFALLMKTGMSLAKKLYWHEADDNQSVPKIIETIKGMTANIMKGGRN